MQKAVGQATEPLQRGATIKIGMDRCDAEASQGCIISAAANSGKDTEALDQPRQSTLRHVAAADDQ